MSEMIAVAGRRRSFRAMRQRADAACRARGTGAIDIEAARRIFTQMVAESRNGMQGHEQRGV
jgi:hypothetical protein